MTVCPEGLVGEQFPSSIRIIKFRISTPRILISSSRPCAATATHDRGAGQDKKKMLFLRSLTAGRARIVLYVSCTSTANGEKGHSVRIWTDMPGPSSKAQASRDLRRACASRRTSSHGDENGLFASRPLHELLRPWELPRNTTTFRTVGAFVSAQCRLSRISLAGV